MKVMILGCGPAGLMAAQGVMDAHTQNHEGNLAIAIISKKAKSPLYGAQYLHAPIPRFTPPDGKIIGYRLIGDTDDYRRKVYGKKWNGTVSPEDLAEEHMGWDIRATYDALWNKWQAIIVNEEIDPVGLHRIMGEEGSIDLVINSIPRDVLCHEGHRFGSTLITAAGDAPDLGIRLPYSCPDNMVVCNAEESPAWYRMSRVFGHTTVEWPMDVTDVPVETAAVVRKPTQHDCNCFPDVMHVGRYGRWEKGVLSHTAYFDAYKKVDAILGQGALF